jgi:hypothetical protein
VVEPPVGLFREPFGGCQKHASRPGGGAMVGRVLYGSLRPA